MASRSMPNCVKCKTTEIEVRSLRSDCAQYKQLLEALQNSQNTTPDNNQCCIERENKIKEDQILIKGLELRVGSIAKEYNDEKKELETELTKVKAENSNLEEKNKRLEDQNRTNLKNIARLEEGDTKLKAEAAKLKADAAKLKAELSTSNDHLQKKIHIIVDQQNKITQLESNIKTKESLILTAQMEDKELEKTNLHTSIKNCELLLAEGCVLPRKISRRFPRQANFKFCTLNNLILGDSGNRPCQISARLKIHSGYCPSRKYDNNIIFQVLIIPKLEFFSFTWKIYSTAETGEEPITNNIVETLKNNCFRLQIDDELICSGRELEKIICHIYKCNVIKIGLHGIFNSTNENYKNVLSRSIKHATLNGFLVFENGKQLGVSEFLKEL
uniref:Uncharacterized protein n=1 Tax=Panagrolaimus sp. PS1159 TaxID=55785 RepID=A0AC35FQP1_9BILA